MSKKHTNAKSDGAISLSTRMIKAIVGAVVAISFIIGSAFAIDARYASAESVKQLRVDIELVSAKNRKATVEDKIFELQQKPSKQRSSRDEALIQRYERELRDANEYIRTLEEKRK